MEVRFTPELEARFAEMATKQGRDPADLVNEIISRYLEEELRFAEVVQRGEEALEREEFLTHEQIGKRLQRFLYR